MYKINLFLTTYSALLFLFILGVATNGIAQQRPYTNENKSKGVPIVHAGVDLLPGPETTSAGFCLAAGYQFESGLSTAIGTGFTFYHDPLSLVPIYLDGSYRFSSGSLVPFISLKIGYSISVLSDTDTNVEGHRGGLMLNPALGVQVPAGHIFDLRIRAGYMLERSSYNFEGWNGRTVTTDITYRRFMAGVEIAF